MADPLLQYLHHELRPFTHFRQLNRGMNTAPFPNKQKAGSLGNGDVFIEEGSCSSKVV
jgi:hypothetical protein